VSVENPELKTVRDNMTDTCCYMLELFYTLPQVSIGGCYQSTLSCMKWTFCQIGSRCYDFLIEMLLQTEIFVSTFVCCEVLFS